MANQQPPGHKGTNNKFKVQLKATIDAVWQKRTPLQLIEKLCGFVALVTIFQ
jgi:hypothetical protein